MKKNASHDAFSFGFRNDSMNKTAAASGSSLNNACRCLKIKGTKNARMRSTRYNTIRNSAVIFVFLLSMSLL